jgi:hypothetical protein
MHVLRRAKRPLREIREILGLTPESISDDILTGQEPVVLRSFVPDWPIVQAARQSTEAVDTYLRRFDRGAQVVLTCGAPEIQGHVSYVEDLSQPNVTRQTRQFASVLDLLKKHAADAKPPLHYMASTAPENCLPGLTAENPFSLGERQLLESIWIGNQSRIPAHYDLPDNIACVAAGRRRFTLFPPDQLTNLYVGPLDMTPAGQPISVVDFHAPDFDKYPNYKKALDAAFTAELGPGDAIFIPSMWWHQVEGLESLNVLINYWWRQSPNYMGPPVDALNHALLTIRDLPPAQKLHWQRVFNHYVFENKEEDVEHIPAGSRGILGGVTEAIARQLRAYLLNRLNR